MSADPAGVRLAGGSDRAAVAAMLGRAFATDPAMSWIIPDPAARAKRLPRLFRQLFDGDAAGMRLVSRNAEAATLWQGPGATHRYGLGEIVKQALPMLHALGPAIPRALKVADAIADHMPAGDFWYLHIAGCDPAAQGKGLGRTMVRAGIDRVAGRWPIYLETATEKNLGFYQTMGFAVTDEWQVASGGPRFWSMLRPAD